MSTQFGFPVEDSISVDSEEHPRVESRDGVSLLMKIVMRISRTRWFAFMRRVFHYQNGVRSELGSDPLNSGFWIGLEFVILVTQILAVTATLAMSDEEKPVWPLRTWAFGYDIGSILSLPLLLWRYKHPVDPDVNQESNLDDFDVEQQRLRTVLELFFAVWFVIGNIWVFDPRLSSFRRSPKLQRLCIALLAWNAVSYSLPFVLFLLLCCCVPLINSSLGYNMNVACTHRGATEEQISRLPNWKYRVVSVYSNGSPGGDTSMKLSKSNHPRDDESVSNHECCICLAKYKAKEDVRELPCSHLFHLKCVDQWLRIISSCPLCKQHLQD
ncbi:E3 ubiquitin-protein ligase [Nymphaea thermarum]|nr:E3 ubiquitin-protein ligase [Nymphaea thermarum]